MNTLTITDISDQLHRKLAERAEANHRSITDEALCCLREVIEQDEIALSGIPTAEWKEIENSLADSIHDRGTPLTEADFQRYSEMSRGRGHQ